MHETFLEAIREAPDDDTPRLVYADWLDEHDQPERAEFIRTQIQMTHLSPESLQFAALQKRSNDLLVVHGDFWRQVLPKWARRRSQFQRGFVWHVDCTALQFLQHGEALMRAAPIRSLRIRRGAGHIVALAESPYLAGLTVLDLPNNSAGNTGAEALATSPHLCQLTTLDLTHNNIEAAGMRALATSPYLPNLTCLNVSFNDILAELATAPWLARLTTLDLAATAYRRGALPTFLASPYLPQLKMLSLSKNNFGDEGAELLAVSPLVEQVIDLNLSFNGIQRYGIQSLGNSSYLKNVQTLDLEVNRFGDAGARALLAWPPLDQLRQLNLRYCDIVSARTDLRRRFGKRVML